MSDASYALHSQGILSSPDAVIGASPVADISVSTSGFRRSWTKNGPPFKPPQTKQQMRDHFDPPVLPTISKRPEGFTQAGVHYVDGQQKGDHVKPAVWSRSAQQTAMQYRQSVTARGARYVQKTREQMPDRNYRQLWRYGTQDIGRLSPTQLQATTEPAAPFLTFIDSRQHSRLPATARGSRNRLNEKYWKFYNDGEDTVTKSFKEIAKRNAVRRRDITRTSLYNANESVSQREDHGRSAEENQARSRACGQPAETTGLEDGDPDSDPFDNYEFKATCSTESFGGFRKNLDQFEESDEEDGECPVRPPSILRTDLDSSSDSEGHSADEMDDRIVRPQTGIKGRLQFSSLIRQRAYADQERLDMSGTQELVFVAPTPPPPSTSRRRPQKWQPALSIREEAGAVTPAAPAPAKAEEMDAAQEEARRRLGDTQQLPESARSESACGRHEFLLTCQEQQVLPVAVLNMHKNTYVNRNMLRSRTLQSRSWAGYNLGQEVVLALSKAMQCGSSTGQIQTLDLSKNGIKSTSATALVKVLAAQCEMLVDLNLAYNELGNEAGLALANMFVSKTSITKLNLSHNKLGDMVCSTIAKGIKFSVSLSDLNLANNNIQSGGAHSLGDALEQNMQLSKLDLSYNNIRRQGAVAVAKSLSFNSTLSWLDLSWNGFGEMGGIEIGRSLECSTGIRHLCLSHNRIGPRASQVIASGILTNAVLETLILDHNPLGSSGIRYLLSSVDNLRNSVGDLVKHNRDISLEGCSPHQLIANTGGGESGKAFVNKPEFDPENPTGHYCLDLSDRHARATAMMIYELARVQDGQNIHDARLGGVVYSESEDSIVHLPDEGVLEFDYLEVKRMPTLFQVLEDHQVPSILRGLKGQAGGVPRLEFLGILAKERIFRCADLEPILELFLGPKFRIKAIAHLWGSIWDQENVLLKARELLGEDGLLQLKEELGGSYAFNRHNATGHYVLRLDNQYDQMVIRRLKEISSEERKVRNRNGLLDLSQKGNSEGWRNETLNDEPIVIDSNTWKVPKEGVLEFDFVSFKRPPAQTEECSPAEFKTYFTQISNTRHYGVENHRLTRGDSRVIPQNELVKADSNHIQEMLTVLRWNSNKYYLSARQIREMMLLLPAGHAGRCDMFVVLWARLVDEENVNKIMDCVEPDQRFWLCKRIGYISLFNPLRPDGFYRLNFGVREENLVASMLIQLSIKEPGENVVDERFNGERYEVPATWLTALPAEGIWELKYVTYLLEPLQRIKAGRADSALPDLRVSLAKKVLGWEFDADFDYDVALVRANSDLESKSGLPTCSEDTTGTNGDDLEGANGEEGQSAVQEKPESLAVEHSSVDDVADWEIPQPLCEETGGVDTGSKHHPTDVVPPT